VLETGTPYQANDFKCVYVREGREVVTHWDFIYHPLVLDPEQAAEGTLVLAHDTSKRVEQAREREQHARALEREKGRVEALGPAAANKRLDLVVDVPERPPMLEAAPQRIRQVVANLLGNAIKFTPDGGTVTLRVRRDGDRLAGAVMDTGVGIAPENGAKLFKPFSQLDMANTRQASGTGLGLSIVKAIVEAHGGSVGVQSEPGQGRFTIPLGHEAGPV
jgi:two-component system phosphate regulon sensor histidine kinase PhoR